MRFLINLCRSRNIHFVLAGAFTLIGVEIIWDKLLIPVGLLAFPLSLFAPVVLAGLLSTLVQTSIPELESTSTKPLWSLHGSILVFIGLVGLTEFLCRYFLLDEVPWQSSRNFMGMIGLTLLLQPYLKFTIGLFPLSYVLIVGYLVPEDEAAWAHWFRSESVLTFWFSVGVFLSGIWIHLNKTRVIF